MSFMPSAGIVGPQTLSIFLFQDVACSFLTHTSFHLLCSLHWSIVKLLLWQKKYYNCKLYKFPFFIKLICLRYFVMATENRLIYVVMFMYVAFYNIIFCVALLYLSYFTLQHDLSVIHNVFNFHVLLTQQPIHLFLLSLPSSPIFQTCIILTLARHVFNILAFPGIHLLVQHLV